MGSKIVKNYIYNLTYQILLVITPFITAPYISRVLHSSGVGIYSYTFTIATAFSLFAALGINTYGQREIAYNQDDINERSKIFWEIFSLRAITTVIVSVVYFAFCFIYKNYTIYLLQQSFSLIGILLDISWFFQGVENFKVITIRNIIVKIFTIILIFTFVKEDSHVGRYILINSVSSFVSYAVFFVNLKKYCKIVPLSELNIKRHIRGSVEYFIPLIATQIYSQLDKIMLGAITASDVENGFYEQARKIVNIIIMLTTSVNSVMYPRIANYYVKNSKNEILTAYRTMFRVILMLLIPVVVGLWLISDNFVIWFFGNDFYPVSKLIKLSCVLIVFMTIGNFVGMQYLSPTGRQNDMTKIYLLAAAVNIALNLVLIKYYQSTGAICASIVSEFVSCVLQILLLEKSEYRFNLISKSWKYFVGAMIMGISIVSFQNVFMLDGILETIFEVIIGVIVYAFILIVFKDDNAILVLRKIKLKISRTKEKV